MDISNISSGKDPKKGLVNVFVEIPKDNNIKYELDKDSGAIMVDRFLHTCNHRANMNLRFCMDGQALPCVLSPATCDFCVPCIHCASLHQKIFSAVLCVSASLR